MPTAGDSVVISGISTLLREVFEPGFIDAMDRDIALLSYFPRDSHPGKNVRWKVQNPIATTGASSYNESATLPTAYPESVKDCAVDYKFVWIPVQVSNPAIAAARGQGGFVDLLSFETKNKLEWLKDAINDQLMVASRTGMGASTDLDGIGAIIDDGQVDATNTGYAGLTFASNTWWKPLVLANGGSDRELKISLMQQMMAGLELPARKAKPTQILTCRAHYDQYGDLMAMLRRFRPNETLDAGYPAMAYGKVNVVAIPALPAGDMYFIQKGDWGYYVLQNFRTEEKFVNADARYFIITHYAQLVCRALHHQGRIADLAS